MGENGAGGEEMTSPRTARARAVATADAARRRSRHGTLGAAIMMAMLLAAPIATRAATTLDCRRTIAKVSSFVVRARLNALRKCRDAILRGTITGPCPDGRAAFLI